MSDNIQLGMCCIQLVRNMSPGHKSVLSSPREQTVPSLGTNIADYPNPGIVLFCCLFSVSVQMPVLPDSAVFSMPDHFRQQVITKSISDFFFLFFISHHKKFFPDLNSHCIANQTFIFPVIGSSTPTLMLYFFLLQASEVLLFPIK